MGRGGGGGGERITLYGKGYGISAILAILVLNMVWCLQSNLDMGKLFSRSRFFIVIEKEINKSPSQIMFTVI